MDSVLRFYGPAGLAVLLLAQHWWGHGGGFRGSAEQTAQGGVGWVAKIMHESRYATVVTPTWWNHEKWRMLLHLRSFSLAVLWSYVCMYIFVQCKVSL